MSAEFRPQVDGPRPEHELFLIDLEYWRWHDGRRWWTGPQLSAYVRQHGQLPAPRPALAQVGNA